MARLTVENVVRAQEIVGLYPQPRSALIPLLHLAQEQDGWVTPDAMEHLAEILDITPAEVLGTCSFYTMFKRQPVGKHLVSICTNIACLLNGGYELLEHAEQSLGIRAGATSSDGTFTLEEVECIAQCGEAPCLQVNYRFFGNVTNEAFDSLTKDLQSGRLADEVPDHGVLNRVRPSALAVQSASSATSSTLAPSVGEASLRAAGPAVSESKGGSAVEKSERSAKDVKVGAGDVADVESARATEKQPRKRKPSNEGKS